MNLPKTYFYTLMILAVCYSCKPPEAQKEEPKENKKEEMSIPYEVVSSLDDFKPTGENWKIVKSVKSDYEKKHDIQAEEGTGVLVNLNNQEHNKHIQTAFEHGDIELDIEFMMPKGSNSGIYFQGRYEIQLLDSWGVEKPKHSDCGGVYQRWDKTKPEGERGYEGVPPNKNAAKAPGLWQHYNILFRAPRFDNEGNKIANAKFERVVHNGITIHENVEVTGPTRAAMFTGDTKRGPVVIQGDHGPVAFRNIKYKLYEHTTPKVKNVSYKYYEGKFHALPNFSKLTPTKEGQTDGFFPAQIPGKKDSYALAYEAEIEMPSDGDYYFHTVSVWGSRVFIDSVNVVNNKGGRTLRSGKIQLKKGFHDVRIEYVQRWGQDNLAFIVEGQGVEFASVASKNMTQVIGIAKNLINVEPSKHPIAQRGFVNFRQSKRTHAISVGDPKKVHYTIDLKQGALLNFWRGSFADLTGMWHSRGQTQALEPLEMKIEGFDGQVIMELDSEDAPWKPSKRLISKGYTITKSGEPIFDYTLGSSTIKDQLRPGADGSSLSRKIEVTAGNDNMWCRAGLGDNIYEIKSKLYSIDGMYYLKVDEGQSKPTLRQSEGRQELLFKLNEPVKYSIIW